MNIHQYLSDYDISGYKSLLSLQSEINLSDDSPESVLASYSQKRKEETERARTEELKLLREEQRELHPEDFPKDYFFSSLAELVLKDDI